MHSVTLATEIYDAARAIVDDVAARPRYTDRSFFLDSAGGDDDRHVARGGFWNATDPSRALYGFTIADAKALRSELRALGHSYSMDDCDALLAQVETGYAGSTMSRKAPSAKRAAAKKKAVPAKRPLTAKAKATASRELARLRKARQRENARDAGLCIVNPAHGPVPGATCKACQDAANESLTRRRKAATPTKKRKRSASKAAAPRRRT
jgi:hypothetical protein